MRHSLKRFVQILKSYLKLWPISEKVFIVPLSRSLRSLIVIEVYDYKMMWYDSRRASYQQCDQLSCLGLDALLVLVILVVILTVIALASVLCVCVIQQLTTSSVNATSHLTCLPVSRTSYHIISSQQESTLYYSLHNGNKFNYFILLLFSTSTNQIFLRLKLLQISSYI